MIYKKTKFWLVMLALLGFSFGANSQVLFDEDFTGAVSTAGFTINQTAGTCGWDYTNPDPRIITGAGFDTDFAIFDSDFCGSGTNTAELISPAFDASASDIYTLEFDHQYRYCCSSVAAVDVWDGSAWNNVYTLPATSVNYPNPAGTESIDISTATGNSAVAQVRFTYTANFAWWWALDNISVTQSSAPSCATPTDLMVTATAVPGEMLFSFTANAPTTTWDAEFLEQTDPMTGTPTAVGVMSNPITLSNTGTLDDHIRVRNDCGVDGLSDWSDILAFTYPSAGEACELAIDVSAGGTFTSGAIAGALEDFCSAPSAPTASNWFVYSAAADGTLEVSACGGSTDTYLSIGTGTCGSLTSLACNDDNGALCTGTQSSASIPVTSGTDYYIAWTDSWSATSFDFNVTYIPPPTCVDPSDVTVSNIGATSFDLSWTVDNHTSLGVASRIFVVPSGGTPITQDLVVPGDPGMYTETVSTSALAALTPSTAYDVYIDLDCGSALVGPVAFTTACAPEVPDYATNFNTFLPICWDEATSGDPVSGPSGLGTGSWGAGTNYNASGAAKINLFSTGKQDWLLSPEFDLSAGGYELVLEVAVTDFANSGANENGGMTTTDDEVQVLYTEDGTTWNLLATYNASNAPDENGQVDIYALASTASNVQFGIWASEGAINDIADYDFHVNDFQVRTPPACPDVSGLMVSNLSLSNVDISWTAAAGASNYLWEIQNDGDPQGTMPAIASGSTAMTMAAATGVFVEGADYVLYVNSDCGGATGNYQSLSFNLAIPPANNDCGGATPMTVGSLSCGTAVTVSNVNATDSGLGSTCSSNAGGDVWLQVIVPASGNITIEGNTNGGPTDTGMEVYEGACGSLVSVECDDDDGPGLHPMIELTGRTPGETLYIQVFEFGNNSFGTWDVCAYEPPAPPVNDDCSGAIAISTSIFGEPGWTAHSNEGASESLSACAGFNADDDIWFSFVAQSANDQIIARGLDGSGMDAVIEVYDSCGGSAIWCEDSNGGTNRGLERAVPGTLIPGNTYFYRVWHYFAGNGGGTVETQVKTFEDGGLNASYCGVMDYDLSQSVYAERDDLGQLYSNPAVPVKGYEFRFQEVGGGLDVTAAHPAEEPYITLGNVGGLEYGKMYEVSVRHRVRMAANGTIDEFWSGYGTPCTIGLGAAPTTQLSDSDCGTIDFNLSDNILAEPLAGASMYRFEFTGGGQTFVKLSNNYSVLLYTVGSSGAGLQYNTTYDVKVRALIEGVWTADGMTCTIGMATAPEDAEVQSPYCGGTYDFPAPNFILATQVYGADSYTWRFTPVGGGLPQETTTSGLSLAFHTTDLMLTSGQYIVDVKVTAGGVTNDYATPCTITINAAAGMNMDSEGELVAANKSLLDSFEASVYPNPNAGQEVMVSLQDLSGEADRATLTITDMSGRVVFGDTYPVKGESVVLRVIPQTQLANGVYSINIEVGALRLTRQLIVN